MIGDIELPRSDVNVLTGLIVSVLLPHVAFPLAAAQENARLFLAIEGRRRLPTATVSANRRAVDVGERAAEHVSDKRGVLLMDGHYEDTVLVAEVDYSTTDDVDFSTCRFTR